jgi:hypothetical protein
MLLLRQSEDKSAAADYRHWIQLGNQPDLMQPMRQTHGLTGFATVYVSLVIFRDDRCMFRLHSFDRALFVTDLFRAVTGIVLTAMAAPLIVSVHLFGPLLLYYPGPIILYVSYVAGLSISAAAALVNAAILSLLARLRADALPISLASGGLVGLWVPTALMQGRNVRASETGGMALEGFVPFGATGALMGALYWLIAIWPRRRRRLARECVSSRNLDQAAQDAVKRKRDRRIPWDGRVPPH